MHSLNILSETQINQVQDVSKKKHKRKMAPNLCSKQMSLLRVDSAYGRHLVLPRVAIVESKYDETFAGEDDGR